MMVVKFLRVGVGFLTKTDDRKNQKNFGRRIVVDSFDGDFDGDFSGICVQLVVGGDCFCVAQDSFEVGRWVHHDQDAEGFGGVA